MWGMLIICFSVFPPYPFNVGGVALGLVLAGLNGIVFVLCFCITD